MIISPYQLSNHYVTVFFGTASVLIKNLFGLRNTELTIIVMYRFHFLIVLYI